MDIFTFYALLSCFNQLTQRFIFSPSVLSLVRSPTCNNLPFKIQSSCENLFLEREIIGSGGFGCVYSSSLNNKLGNVNKGAMIAIKEQSLRREERLIFLQEVKNIAAFRGDRHFLQIFGWAIGKSENHGYIITELAKGNMLKYILLHELSLQEKIRIVRQVVETIIIMHSKGYVHPDLKWSNFLYFDDGANTIKLGDFGCSQKDDDLTSRAGTRNMMAPEVANIHMLRSVRSKPADIYSLGRMIDQIFGGFYPCNFYPNKRLFSRLTSHNPAERPTAEEVLNILDTFKSSTHEINLSIVAKNMMAACFRKEHK